MRVKLQTRKAQNSLNVDVVQLVKVSREEKLIQARIKTENIWFEVLFLVLTGGKD